MKWEKTKIKWYGKDGKDGQHANSHYCGLKEYRKWENSKM